MRVQATTRDATDPLGLNAPEPELLRILLVEDDDVDAVMVQAYLSEVSDAHVVVHLASRLCEARDLLTALIRPNCILLDLNLPDASGLEALDALVAAAPDVPLVVLTGLRDDRVPLAALHKGAQDYLVKGRIDADVLWRSIRYARERKASELALRRQALYDPLTGLANRSLFLDRLTSAVARTARGHGFLAVLMVDLDHFKWINDSFGHQAGDDVLSEVGKRMGSVARPADLIARQGGDEFLVLCEDLASELESAAIAQRLGAAIAADMDVAGRMLSVGASIGIASRRGSEDSAERLLRDADAAMYAAKKRGRGRYAIFDDTLRQAVLARVNTEALICSALVGDLFVVHFQPIVDITCGRADAAEALVRCRGADGRLILPGDFIPVAEDSGQIGAIGELVLSRACTERSTWPAWDGKGARARMNVNVSKRQLGDEAFPATVARILSRHHVDPADICLEVTESALLHDDAAAAKALTALSALGVGLALDDFGTGFSSLTHLTTFPVDEVKIDRTFVTQLGRAAPTAIVEAILTLGRTLGIRVVAEGVETVSQLQVLRDLGCRYVQGYLLAAPAPAGAVDWAPVCRQATPC